MTNTAAACRYCGAVVASGRDVCRAHDDLPDAEQTAFCTRSPDCRAAADGHEFDCPVEAELRREFGY